MSAGRTSSVDRHTRSHAINSVQTRAQSGNNMAPPTHKTVTLPPFHAKDIKFWFLQVEALFRNGGITQDQAKFDHIITALDVTAAADIRDVIEEPPEEDLYQTIKSKLIERLAVSESARIKDILSNQPMGDRKPSQHLRHIKAQAGAHFSEAALESLWLETLPADVKLIVASAKGLPLDQQAEMADNVMDVAGVRRLAAIRTEAAPKLAAADPQIASLAQQISALAKKFDSHVSRIANAEAASKRKRPRDKSPASTSRTAATASSPEDGAELCWYHRKFGENAKKCTSPCSWIQPHPGNGSNQS